MRRHGVVRHIQPSRDLTSGKAIRLLLHQQAKRFEPGRLGKCGKGIYGELWFHMSGSIDIYCDSQVNGTDLDGFRGVGDLICCVSKPFPSATAPRKSAYGINPTLIKEAHFSGG